jgi:membrane protease YdiL (CAAX protease family)
MQGSAFEIRSISLRGIVFGVLSKLGPGFDYALVGLILVAVFTARLALGSASLPLTLPKSSVLASDGSGSWDRVESFLWVLLALLPLILWFWSPPFMNFILNYFVFSHLPVFKGIDIATLAANAVTDLIIVVVAVRMIGKEAWDALGSSLRWPAVKGLALAFAFPVGVAALVSIGQFLFELFRRVDLQTDRLGLPQIGSFFSVPSIGLFSLLFLAFTEELIFRGLLQPLFIRRYAPTRGIFLVGIAFAAAHFSTDSSVGYTDWLVVLQLCRRLSSCLALSFIVGWLTLRTGSVLPAAVTHGLSNVLGSSPLGPQFSGIGPLTDLLEAVLAYVLFRYWPVETQTPQEFKAASASPAP